MEKKKTHFTKIILLRESREDGNGDGGGGGNVLRALLFPGYDAGWMDGWMEHSLIPSPTNLFCLFRCEGKQLDKFVWSGPGTPSINGA